jgi:hypothetical protein
MSCALSESVELTGSRETVECFVQVRVERTVASECLCRLLVREGGSGHVGREFAAP